MEEESRYGDSGGLVCARMLFSILKLNMAEPAEMSQHIMHLPFANFGIDRKEEAAWCYRALHIRWSSPDALLFAVVGEDLNQSRTPGK